MTEPYIYVLPILNIILLEIILSVDNAAVLATMVRDLPEEQRKKAMTYGIVGAYILRGASFLFVEQIFRYEWLKIIGGGYLIFLAARSLIGVHSEIKLKYKFFFLNQFVSTIIAIEIMDFVFSIDNVFAISAFTQHIGIIFAGVFLGIIIMRFAATKFITIMDSYPILNKIAYYIIGILGIRLVLSFWLEFLNSTIADLSFSILVAFIFTFPLLFNKLSKK